MAALQGDCGEMPLDLRWKHNQITTALKYNYNTGNPTSQCFTVSRINLLCYGGSNSHFQPIVKKVHEVVEIIPKAHEVILAEMILEWEYGGLDVCTLRHEKVSKKQDFPHYMQSLSLEYLEK